MPGVTDTSWQAKERVARRRKESMINRAGLHNRIFRIRQLIPVLLLFTLVMLLSISNAVTVRASFQGQLLLTATDSWESGIMWRPCVVNAGSTYMMWYSGETPDYLTDRIGLATSPDAVTWTKYPQNPIMSGTPGQWDGGSVNDEWVIQDGGQYKMWYGGQTTVGGNVTAYQIGYATSPDGIHWTKYVGNPVLTTGPPGTWDSLYVHIPTVIRNGSSYIMYYKGQSTPVSLSGSPGMATSPRWSALDKDRAADPRKIQLGLRISARQ